MEKATFLYVKARETEYEAFPWYVRYGPGKEKRRLQYLVQRLPVEAREKKVLGRDGLELQLPFTRGQLRDCGEDFLQGLPGRLKEQYRSEAVAVASDLFSLFPAGGVCGGQYIPLFMAEEIVDGVLKRKRLEKRDARLVLFDGDSVCSPFLLSLFGKHYNYLTFVTDGPSAECEEEMEHLFEEYGLAVSVQKEPVTGELSGDVFIDTAGAAKKYCRNLQKGCVLIDLLGKNDLRYTESRLREGMLCRSFQIGKKDDDGNEEAIPLQLAEAACFGAKGQDPSFWRKNLWECYEKIVGERLSVLAINGEKLTSAY